MTVVARRFAATPVRTASVTWEAIATLVCQQDETAQKEFSDITGLACSSIAEEALRDHALIIAGSGPRLRVYCLYGEDAITGERQNEDALSWQPTAADWRGHLPCSSEDFPWIDRELRKKAGRFTAYDVEVGTAAEEEETPQAARSTDETAAFIINPEKFKNL